jgi:hypothetical protein
MKRRSRYFVIILGAVTFFVLSPIIVLYVSNLRYDFETQGYVIGGIITVKTEPKDAQFFLDDKLIDNTPASAEFLTPGEYNIRIEKEGYFPWTKRLEVKTSKVTWINNSLPKLYLLFKNPTETSINENVLDFVVADKKLFYLTNTALVQTYVTDPSQTSNILVPKGFTSLELSPSLGYAILSNQTERLLINLNKQTQIPATTLLGKNSELIWNEFDQLFTLDAGVLSVIDTVEKKKTQLADKLTAATITDNRFYSIVSQNSKLQLQSQTLSSLGKSTETTVLLDLPNFTKTRIIATPQKELFVIGDDTLYKVNSSLEKLADNIISANFELDRNALIVTSKTGLYFYDFDEHVLRLITRQSEPIPFAEVYPELGYAFLIKNNAFFALELDDRDQRNNYELTKLTAPLGMQLDQEGKRGIILDSGKLRIFKLR